MGINEKGTEGSIPCNTTWVAREALKKLKQIGTIQEYVKRFSSLILDINNMSEEDTLFNFISDLQPWVRAELRRQGAKDLPTTFAIADALMDYPIAASSSNDKKKEDDQKAIDMRGKFKSNKH